MPDIINRTKHCAVNVLQKYSADSSVKHNTEYKILNAVNLKTMDKGGQTWITLKKGNLY